jgi:hypothetical protein
MKRHAFITLLGGAAAWPLTARAEQRERTRRIGVLLPAAADDTHYQTFVGAFLQGLALSGWSVGRNVRIDTHWVPFAGTRPNWLRPPPISSWPLAPPPWGRCYK